MCGCGFEIEKEDPYRCGVIVGSGIGSLQQIEKQYTTIQEKGPGRVAPLMVPMMISIWQPEMYRSSLGLKESAPMSLQRVQREPIVSEMRFVPFSTEMRM